MAWGESGREGRGRRAGLQRPDMGEWARILIGLSEGFCRDCRGFISARMISAGRISRLRAVVSFGWKTAYGGVGRAADSAQPFDSLLESIQHGWICFVQDKASTKGCRECKCPDKCFSIGRMMSLPGGTEGQWRAVRGAWAGGGKRRGGKMAGARAGAVRLIRPSAESSFRNLRKSAAVGLE